MINMNRRNLNGTELKTLKPPCSTLLTPQPFGVNGNKTSKLKISLEETIRHFRNCRGMGLKIFLKLYWKALVFICSPLCCTQYEVWGQVVISSKRMNQVRSEQKKNLLLLSQPFSGRSPTNGVGHLLTCHWHDWAPRGLQGRSF